MRDRKAPQPRITQHAPRTNQPLLYEINTRCWLRELSSRHEKIISLTNVPDAAFQGWQGLGFTHIWLMGVWTTGPRSRAQALKSPHLRNLFDKILPGWREDDVPGSPYAIADYKVPRALGGERGLKNFRQKLHSHGMKLLLDFVPNHLGLDHPWLSERPELFVQSQGESPETFAQETRTGIRWLAHGKDPCFPAWTDTVQLDYRRPETRAAMTDLLHSIARRCDGVRCDMAMLLLNDVFQKTWAHLPEFGAPPSGGQRLEPPVGETPNTPSEFWADAISAIKKTRPDFLFLAEAYWNLEARLQSLDFDYTYDKRLYDFLVFRNGTATAQHLQNLSPDFIQRSAHFLENHDEPRIATLLSLDEHRAAMLLILGLPGLPLLHDCQPTGSTVQVPVQLARRPLEIGPGPNPIAEIYAKVLTAMHDSTVGRGRWKLLRPRPAWPGNPTAQNFILVQWQSRPPAFNLVVVNLAPHRGQCYAPLEIEHLAEHNWQMQDLLGEEHYERFGEDLQTQGLYLDLPAHGAQLFHFEPMSR